MAEEVYFSNGQLVDHTGKPLKLGAAAPSASATPGTIPIWNQMDPNLPAGLLIPVGASFAMAPFAGGMPLELWVNNTGAAAPMGIVMGTPTNKWAVIATTAPALEDPEGT